MSELNWCIYTTLFLAIFNFVLTTFCFIDCKHMVNRTPEESAEHIIKTERILKQKGYPR